MHNKISEFLLNSKAKSNIYCQYIIDNLLFRFEVKIQSVAEMFVLSKKKNVKM